MKRFIYFLSGNLRRTVISPGFLGASAGLCALSLLSVYQEIRLMGNQASVTYLYEIGIYANFWILFLLFGSIPGATLFCADWENRYFRFSVIRSGKTCYGVGTSVSCFLSGTAAVYLGEWLFLGILCLRYPLFSEQDAANTGFTPTPFSPLLTSNKILLFYAARFLIKACCAGFHAVFALWLSTKITNMFVALASPVIFNYLWENVAVFLKLPSYLQFSSVAKGFIFINDSLAWAVLYPVLLFTGLAAVFGVLFTLSAKRRLENG